MSNFSRLAPRRGGPIHVTKTPVIQQKNSTNSNTQSHPDIKFPDLKEMRIRMIDLLKLYPDYALVQFVPGTSIPILRKYESNVKLDREYIEMDFPRIKYHDKLGNEHMLSSINFGTPSPYELNNRLVNIISGESPFRRGVGIA